MDTLKWFPASEPPSDGRWVLVVDKYGILKSDWFDHKPWPSGEARFHFSQDPMYWAEHPETPVGPIE